MGRRTDEGERRESGRCWSSEGKWLLGEKGWFERVEGLVVLGLHARERCMSTLRRGENMVSAARETDYDETRRSSTRVEKGAREDFCQPFQTERRFACFFLYHDYDS